MSRIARLLATVLSGAAIEYPLTLPNFKFWLDASDRATLFQASTLTTPAAADTDPVGGARDKSGSGNHATQTTAGQRPPLALAAINGQSALDFSNHALVTPSFLNSGFNTSFTFFIVATLEGSSNHIHTAHRTGSNFEWYSQRRTAGTLLQYVTDRLSDDTLQATWSGALGLEVFTYDGATKTLSWNGVEVQEAATGNLAFNGALTIGGFVDGTGDYDGKIATVGIYQSVLPWAQRAELGRFFNTRYNLWTAAARIVFEGDSLTVGTGSTASNDYPSVVMTSFSGRTKYNVATSGHATTDVISSLTTDVILKRHYHGLNYACIWIGTNDLEAGTTAATTYANIVSICQSCQAAGFRVVVLTLLPRNATDQTAFDAARASVNTSLRANWATFANALADVAADSRIGDDGDWSDGTYFSDSVHLTDAGYAIVAGVVVTALTALGA